MAGDLRRRDASHCRGGVTGWRRRRRARPGRSGDRRGPHEDPQYQLRPRASRGPRRAGGDRADDFVLLAPGSLFTSVLATCALPDVAPVPARTAVRVVSICNLEGERSRRRVRPPWITSARHGNTGHPCGCCTPRSGAQFHFEALRLMREGLRICNALPADVRGPNGVTNVRWSIPSEPEPPIEWMGEEGLACLCDSRSRWAWAGAVALFWVWALPAQTRRGRFGPGENPGAGGSGRPGGRGTRGAVR
jgi:hypothetical protein